MNSNFNVFHSKFANILDIEEDELVPDFPIDDSSIDSLARLSLAALVVELFQFELEDNRLNECSNYKDLIKLIENQIELKNA